MQEKQKKAKVSILCHNSLKICCLQSKTSFQKTAHIQLILPKEQSHADYSEWQLALCRFRSSEGYLLVPEAACWSEWALQLSSLTTSPTLFFSVCISLLLPCSSPETSAVVHPDPRPLLACAARRWEVETAASVWAASAGLQVTSETWGNSISVAELLNETLFGCHHFTRLFSNYSLTPGK